MALKRHVFHHVAVELDVDRHVIAAQRIVAFAVQAALAQARKLRGDLACSRIMSLYSSRSSSRHPNISRTLWIPSTRASISSRVL